jgi:hypothetical protein
VITTGVVSVLFALGLGLAQTGPAMAGTNGQEVALRTFYGYSAHVCGYNQNSHPERPNEPKVCSWVNTSQNAYQAPYYTYVYGWWWKGPLSIDAYGASGQYLGTFTFNIPTDQGPGNDWVRLQYLM